MVACVSLLIFCGDAVQAQGFPVGCVASLHYMPTAAKNFFQKFSKKGLTTPARGVYPMGASREHPIQNRNERSAKP